MESLSQKETKELKEIFDLVDTDHSGAISLKELRKLMTALHLRPTERELDELFEETRPGFSKNALGEALAPLPSTMISTSISKEDKTAAVPGRRSSVAAGGNTVLDTSDTVAGVSVAARAITFPQFASMMARRVQSEYTAEQLRSAFQLFESPDMPEGFVSTKVLAHALATYGSQKLEQEEVDRLIASIDPNNTGHVNYYEFVDLVTE